MSYANLTVDRRGTTLYVTINRPKALNALNQATLAELTRVFGVDYARDPSIRGVLLTGEGGKAFVAGADIKEFVDVAEGGQGERMATTGQDLFFVIERFHVPVVALVDGYALGGGCELAMACHLRIATESARFGQPEVNLGIIPGYGGTQRLNQYIGKGKATELILTGRMMKAAEARQSGLVSYVLPDRVAAEAKAEELLALIAEKGPLAIAGSIRAINAYYENAAGFAEEAAAFAETTVTRDFREGAAAFVEKRPASFEGK